ncbi:enteropeptidase-like isoform X2 [Xenia sp. Carnegie-2017]|uniref:enteropeptidase-like isoform X2 n=1 Tax=Xenia sp. Carnegie-2017 TaxID=2897299 RepID=UPI001F03CD70|nr:enteropeptidase-like isoform X2 [Xenia sp. Carnegie-2017]
MHRRSTSVIMVSKMWRLFLLVVFVTSFSSKSFGINICSTRAITLSSGYITSPNYPNDYDNNINCILTLRAPFGFSFRFTFTKLDLEVNPSGQCYDHVKISGIRSRHFCNKITPFNFNPGGNVVTVQMYSDASITKDGFRLQFVRYVSGTTSTPTPTVCDYRLGTISCPWHNEKTNDDFDWSIGRGSTSSSNTGPSTDSKGSIYGKYFFLEASSPRQQGDKAWLVSQSFSYSRKCLTFYYHMYGNHIGSLNVYRQTYGLFQNSVWSKSGNHGNSWFKAQVDVTGVFYYNYYKIIIEGVRGSGFKGDIAVDDIELKDGYCNVQSTTPLYSLTTVPPWKRTSSSKSHSTRNIAIISGAIGGLVLLLIIGLVIIYYVRQKNRQRNSTSSTTQPGSAQNPNYQTNQHGSLQNPTYSSNQQNTMTGIPPPSYESVCNTSPFYIHATPGFTNHGAIPHLVPATNLGQNVYVVPMSTIVPGDNRNPNPNPGEIVRNVPASIAPVENVGARRNVYESNATIVGQGQK